MVRLLGQTIFGGTVSNTVTAAVHVFELAFSSVTVNVTVFVPAIFAQVKVESLNTSD